MPADTDVNAGVGAAQDTWFWDRYWHYDRLASCFDRGQANYGEPVAAPWRDFFGGFADGSAVLDLCTGNGALALIASETARDSGKSFAIIGVDQADIDPAAHVSQYAGALAAIDFRAGVRAEALPFADDRFDAVVSQYGAEYAPLEAALAEAVRVLRPGGALRLVVHAAEGRVAERAAGAVRDADFLLDEAALPAAALACFRAVVQAERGGDEQTAAAAKRALGAFETALKRTGNHLAVAADAEMLRNSARVLLDAYAKRQLVDIADLEAKTEEVRLEIEAHRERLQALLEAALTEAGCRNMTAHMQTLGCAGAGFEPLMDGDHLIGYALEGRLSEG